MNGRHRVPRQVSYWKCPACPTHLAIDLDLLNVVAPGVGFWAGLFDTEPSIEMLPTQVLEWAEREVEKHEEQHLVAA